MEEEADASMPGMERNSSDRLVEGMSRDVWRRMALAGLLGLWMPHRGEGGVSAVWAHDGGEKVVRAELRATGQPEAVTNSVWDGSGIRLHGARNEVVSFNLVLEAATEEATGVSVAVSSLEGPRGTVLASTPAEGEGLFVWTNRQIEVFFVRYLEIKGLSRLSYETYDERHVPERMRRPWTGEGIGEGGWTDRPDHNQFYPDIAVPMELVPSFSIAAGENQSAWVDVYIPKDAPAGVYTGRVSIVEGGSATSAVPVLLQVRAFALPDEPVAKTMVFLGYRDINQRYLDEAWPNAGTTNDALSKVIRDRHFQMAHRHKISLIDGDPGAEIWEADRPRPEWEGRLSGGLFTRTNGYEGPGEGTGNGVFSIGTYGTWGWQDEGATGMWAHVDGWESWFASNAPGTERFLYLVDESSDYEQTETWAQWMEANPGPGSNLRSFATIPLPEAVAHVPSLDVAASWFTTGLSNLWEECAQSVRTNPAKRMFLYNGKRPSNGSFATEDDGIALRELAWVQYKKQIDRWFFWESTYYNNYQGGMGETRVFQSAFTFGAMGETNEVMGETGWNYSNGDGVLFYPGTDRVFPGDSYGVAGPFASLRLKQWRRGIQDVDYLALAATFDPGRVGEIVEELVPKAAWEYGVTDTNDPTWVRSDISWPTDPDRWEAARKELGDLIEQALSNQVVQFTRTDQDGEFSDELSWPVLGPGYRYTVEAATSMAEGAWTSMPGEWPQPETNWTIPSGELSGHHYFRVKAVP